MEVNRLSIYRKYRTSFNNTVLNVLQDIDSKKPRLKGEPPLVKRTCSGTTIASVRNAALIVEVNSVLAIAKAAALVVCVVLLVVTATGLVAMAALLEKAMVDS